MRLLTASVVLLLATITVAFLAQRDPSACRLAYETPAFVIRECANDSTRWLRTTGGQWHDVTTTR